MKKAIILLSILLLLSNVFSAEIKEFENIDIDKMAAELQVMPKAKSSNHFSLVWWIPIEYWQIALAKSGNLTQEDMKFIYDAMNGISMIAVVQADVSEIGDFNFYSKYEVENLLRLNFIDEGAEKTEMVVEKVYSEELEQILMYLKPILTAAMGNLGSNMHFFIINDSDEAGERIIDPYKAGYIEIDIASREKEVISAQIELPANSLFVPRKCPNGKDAHITWKYCPWTGEKLEE